MGNFKGNNNTTTTTTQPNPAAMQAYYGLLNRAGQVSQTPYQAYGGELTAPINAQQQAGFGNINQNAGFASPFIQQGANYANEAAQPLSAADIERYQSPYTQQVVNATEAQFNNQNAQQQQQVLGNAISQGALGGDRTAVAQANLAGQQQQAQAPVIAGLYNQGYQNASQMALAQQQQQAQAAYSLGNLGVAGQNAALQGAGAQVGAGSLEQQTQQQLDQALYGQFAQKQAFPYQQLGWLAGIDTGVGSQMGGTSTTTPPPPNPWSTVAGLGLGAAAAFAKRGGRISGFAPGGMVSPTMQPTMPMAGGPPQNSPMAGFGNLMSRLPPGLAAGFGQIQDRMQASPQWQAFQRSPFGQMFGGQGGWGGQGGQVNPMAGFGGMPHFDDGGAVSGFGGMPWGGAGGWIPSMQITHGSGAPKPPSPPSSQKTPSASGLGGALSGLGSLGSSAISGLGEAFPEAGAAVADMLPLMMLQRGGHVRGYDDGGDVEPYTLGDIGPGTGFDFNPIRTDANRAYDEPLADVPMPRVRPASADALPPDNGKFMPVPAEPEPEPIIGGGADSRVGAPNESPEPRSGFGHLFGLSDAAKSGLMAAGLGMMASRSPFLGQAIGEGGLQGMSVYSGQKKQEASVEHARKLLEQHAEDTRKRLEMESARLAQAKEAQQATQDYRMKALEQGKTPPGMRMVNGNLERIPGYDDAIRATEEARSAAKSGPGMSPEAKEVMARRMIEGDMSGYNSLGRTGQGMAVRNELNNMATEIVMRERGLHATDAAKYLNDQKQAYGARQIGLNTEARTAGSRETNLNLILRATDAAIPAALEASNKVERYGGVWVPINKIVQHGQVMTSNPELAEFGMANLQLAEHWARAMNPTGVMRESDRDKALSFLSTATSKETYARMLAQLQKQITRERDSIHGVNPSTPINPNAPTPEPGAEGHRAGLVGSGGASPVRVSTPAEAQALAPGTKYVTPDGRTMTR